MANEIAAIAGVKQCTVKVAQGTPVRCGGVTWVTGPGSTGGGGATDWGTAGDGAAGSERGRGGTWGAPQAGSSGMATGHVVWRGGGQPAENQ